jgi:hypothetical protein
MEKTVLIGIAVFFVFYIIVTEVLDWIGRLEIIRHRYPKIPKLFERRAFRIILLLVTIGMLARVITEGGSQPRSSDGGTIESHQSKEGNTTSGQPHSPAESPPKPTSEPDVKPIPIPSVTPKKQSPSVEVREIPPKGVGTEAEAVGRGVTTQAATPGREEEPQVASTVLPYEKTRPTYGRAKTTTAGGAKTTTAGGAKAGFPSRGNAESDSHAHAASSSHPQALSPSVQGNSGGINIQQGTVGPNSPIVNSPITVGDVPRRLSSSDLSNITQYLSEVKVKTRIQIKAAENSNASPFADDFYRALKDAGWPMVDEGVTEVLLIRAPGNKFRGVEIICRGEPVKPNQPVQVTEGDPVFYIGTALKTLGVPVSLTRDPNQEADLITLQFEGLPETAR